MLIRAADRGDRAHAAEREQIEGGSSKDRGDGVAQRKPSRSRPSASRRTALARRVVGPDPRARSTRAATRSARSGRPAAAATAPADPRRQPRRQQRHDRAADADAEIGDPHRLAARLVEPARDEHLTRQRPAADVAERVEKVEEVERPAATSRRGRSARRRPSRCPPSSAGAGRSDRRSIRRRTRTAGRRPAC